MHKIEYTIKISGAELHQLFTDLLFRKVTIDSNHIMYKHDNGAVLIFRNVRSNQLVSPPIFSLVKNTLYNYEMANEKTLPVIIEKAKNRLKNFNSVSKSK